ncbi:MAG: hypothetical protein K2Q06_05695 [Parvularculaceae bacterium]|nr:hypothetical protein [Parvularculaceae bacterium]
MAGLLTNESAQVALATLRNINKNLGQVQSQISTGKSVSNARDNAAIFAVATTIESDAESFKAISQSLSLGNSTVNVARVASEQVTKILRDIKDLTVAAQEENVDRATIQTDVARLIDQVESIVGAAQFNGLNLVSGSGDVDFLASIDRTTGGITPSTIEVNRQNLTTTQAVFGTGNAVAGLALTASGAVGGGGTSINAAIAAAPAVATLTLTDGAGTADGVLSSGEVVTVTVGSQTFSANQGGAIVNIDDAFANIATQITAFAALAGSPLAGTTVAAGAGAAGTATLQLTNNTASSIALSVSVTNAGSAVAGYSGALSGAFTGGNVNAGVVAAPSVANFTAVAANGTKDGDGLRFTLAGQNFDFVFNGTTTVSDAASSIVSQINNAGITGLSATLGTGGQFSVSNNLNTQAIVASTTKSGGTAGGGLGILKNFSVNPVSGTSEEKRVALEQRLQDIEGAIQTAVKASANFGSAQKRFDIQGEFVTQLIDSLKLGVGTLTDANIEEASARLQSLQVQQQLGIQALSIANQQPQAILALFR